MNPKSLRVTPALVVAVGALLVALSGSAVAISAHHGNGDKLIAKHSLSGDRLHKNTLTGKQIKESTLGTVPRATTATNVGGATIKKIFFAGAPGSAVRTIFKADGLVLQAGCSASLPVLNGTGTTSDFHLLGVGDSTPYNLDDSSAWTGSLLDGHVEGSFTAAYGTAAGDVITLSIAFDRASTFGSHDECTVFGTAVIG